MMGPRDLVGFIHERGDALDTPAVVGEDERRAMPADLVAQVLVDRWPDGFLRQRPELRHRADDTQVQFLALAGVDDGHRPGNALLHAAEEAGDLLQWPLCRRQANAHRPLMIQRFQSFQQQCQEDAALVAAQRVDLVNDAVAHAAETFPAARRQQQVQRFRRRDEHVRWLANLALPLGRRRVAGADGRLEPGQREAHRAGCRRNALERLLQVAVDVVVERLQRRDVQDSHTAGEVRLAPQVVETGEERRQRLARAGWRQDQRALPGGDGGPTQPLRRRRLAQRLAEPLPHRRQEQFERVVGVHAHIVRMCASVLPRVLPSVRPATRCRSRARGRRGQRRRRSAARRPVAAVGRAGTRRVPGCRAAGAR